MNTVCRRTSQVLSGYAHRIRELSTQVPHNFQAHFSLHRDFFSTSEQRCLLSASLSLLDINDSPRQRRLRQKYKRPHGQLSEVQDVFAPDDYYHFEEAHYDDVIQHYREMSVTSWPEAQFPDIVPSLRRLHSACPTQDIQTHILHLASNGEILPHVDNISASGSWILGVSLGDERILRLEDQEGQQEGTVDIVLPSGSVYIQRDDVRYRFRHSILSSQRQTGNRQRLSIMIRDRLQAKAGM